MALAADQNNRQLHPTERQRAAELAASSKGKFTKEQIEEQMRLMGNDALGVKANTLTILQGQEIADSRNGVQDPVPIIVQGNVAIELPGKANAEIQQFIVASTKDGAGYIPGASPYQPSTMASNPPVITNAPPTSQNQTAKCANSDLACRSGVGVQQSVPISAQTREAIADSASNISRQAGVVAAGAVAVSSQAGPYGKPAKAVAIGATAIGLGADAVEQIARPNTGQVIVNSTSLIVQTLTERLPYGGVVTPITNEILEAWKASGSSMSVQEWVNSRLRNK